MDAVAADGEIVALDQQEAEIARQRGVFEIGFAELAGRQKPDARLVAVGAGAQGIAERLEERRHPFDVHRLVERGEGARQHQPVFQRVACARRRLGAVAEHPPAPVGAAADIGGVKTEIAAARRFDAADRAQIFGAAGNGRRRDRALGNQTALAVEIAQHQFQQLRALHDAGGQLLPVGLVDQERQMAQRPKPVGGFAGRAVGHAGFPQMPVGGAETPVDFGRAQRREGVEEPVPDRPRRPVLRDIFIGNSRQAGIVAHPLRHPPVGRTDPVALTACPAAFLAVLSRHPNSPHPEPHFDAIETRLQVLKTLLPIQCRSGVLKSSVKGNSIVRSSRGGSILPGVWP